MKRTIFLLMSIVIGYTSYAQNFKKDRSAAKSAWDKGELDKAKELIDKTITYPEAETDADCYQLMGGIYMAIADKVRDTSDKRGFGSLHPDPVEVAINAYEKCEKLDVKGKHKLDLVAKKLVFGPALYYSGVYAFMDKDFFGKAKTPDMPKAEKYFQKSVTYNKAQGIVDTLALYALAMSNEKLGNSDKAISAYSDLTGMGWKEKSIYASLANLLSAKGKVDEAVEVLKKGLTLYPGDFDLIITQANIYIQSKNHKKALENLAAAKLADPNNKTILFAVGVTYDLMKNDSTISKEQRNEYFKEAEKGYKESLAVDPNYFDACFNLGAMYFNKGGDVINAANKLDIKEEKKFNVMIEEGNSLLKESLPYLETAEKIQPNDIPTLTSLKEIYLRLQMLDKLKAVKAKLEQ